MAKRRKSTDIEPELAELQRSITEVAEMDDPAEVDIERSSVALDQFEELQQELAEAVAYEERVEAVRSASFLENTGETPAPRGEVRRGRGPEVVVQADPFEVLRSNTAHMDKAEYTEALRS